MQNKTISAQNPIPAMMNLQEKKIQLFFAMAQEISGRNKKLIARSNKGKNYQNQYITNCNTKKKLRQCSTEKYIKSIKNIKPTFIILAF